MPRSRATQGLFPATERSSLISCTLGNSIIALVQFARRPGVLSQSLPPVVLSAFRQLLIARMVCTSAVAWARSRGFWRRRIDGAHGRLTEIGLSFEAQPRVSYPGAHPRYQVHTSHSCPEYGVLEPQCRSRTSSFAQRFGCFSHTETDPWNDLF